MGYDRGVAMPVQYVLLVAIVTILSSGLFVTAGGFVQTQQSDAVHHGLDVVGNRLVNDLAAANQLADSIESSGSVQMTVDAPREVAGSTYIIAIEDHPDPDQWVLRLRSVDPEISREFQVHSNRALSTGAVSGGPLIINATTNTVEVRNA